MTKTIAWMVIGIIVTAVISGSVVYFVTQPAEEEPGPGPEPGPTEKGLIGQSWHTHEAEFHVLAGDAGDWFASDIGYDTRRTNANRDVTVQITHVKMLIDMQKIDGLIFAAADVGGARPIAEMAHDAGIPCFTVDTDIDDSPYVDLFIGWDEIGTAEKLAQAAVDLLTEKYGEPRGLVYVMTGGLTETAGMNRWEGTQNVLDQYPDITYYWDDTGWMPSNAEALLGAEILEHGTPDAVINCSNGGIAPGLMSALDAMGLTAKTGEEGHVIYVGMDANTYHLHKMREGRVDHIAEQPTLFYVPLAVYWLDKVLTEGTGALPQVGETYTADDIDISGMSGTEHYDVDPWEYPIWAPATVESVRGHLWFKTQGYVLGPDEVDNPAFYGNMIEAMTGYT